VSSTRERILSAACELIERDGGAPNMSELARAVGISRQALYLHFPDRASLLLALVAHVDEREGLQAGVAAVQAAPDAASQIRAWAQMQARRNPQIAPLARALDQARHTDQAASQAWQDRTGNRMHGAAAIITRLREEGRLHPSWTAEEAATLLWELTSFRVWDDLVNESGLTPDRYTEIVAATVLAALASPLSERARPEQARRPGATPRQPDGDKPGERSRTAHQRGSASDRRG
jgi:AcrR family transcriptional regulator